MCEHAFKNLANIAEKMYDKIIIENGVILWFISER